MEVTLVRSERGIVKTPIAEIIGRAVPIPFLNRKIECDLHPMSLGLIVPEHRRCGCTGVRVEPHRQADQSRE